MMQLRVWLKHAHSIESLLAQKLCIGSESIRAMQHAALLAHLLSLKLAHE